MKVYGRGKDDTLLPDLTLGQSLSVDSIKATETFTYPPARFSEAMLVKKLEELGIGRPSTYAPTISTVQTRGYVEKTDLEGVERDVTELELKDGNIKREVHKVITGADNAKLVPTAIAEITTDFLVKYFPNIVDFDFTAHVEADFDEIARGKVSWPDMIKGFYKDFHPQIEKSADVSRNEVSQARLLGNDPKSNEPIYARFGRYGPMLLKGDIEDESAKPVFAPMPSGKTLDTVKLEDALEMFKLPKVVGKTEDGDEITANIGRFGPYVQINKLFVSIKPLDPHTITEEEARQLYKEKLAKEKAKNIKEFASGLKIINGPYGPYVTDGKKNARIAKDINPKSLSEATAKEMLEKSPAKKSFRRRRRTP
jgi:DNA topoisomerase-1